ncbi:hypothetical protein BMW23_0128 [Bodo saltans virus]|uniref:C2H2-type domain-containing protein n=1 Tax=Bodo saltans virus TaxID=2024608 RepID=A0A2H4UTG8_9VIRU|nr:hypothetical protein QJ851_gp0125 [Bodo saltans virus]ATZ80188.1 hypothetical protein BMW23_0128 [Bodo saltans virus]
MKKYYYTFNIMEIKFIYNCDKCNFHTNANSLYEKHLITGKHKNGYRTVRCDKKFIGKCDECDYKTNNKINMEIHILNNHSTREIRELKYKFYCKYCDYGSFSNTGFQIHIKSKKHILIENAANKSSSDMIK